MALRQVMDRNDVKGKDLAQAVGVTKETVSRWRTDPKGMTGANLIAVRDHLRRYEPGLDVDDLLEGQADPEPAAVSEGGK